MSLAIIIPAYKDLYLEKTLLSISNQTDKNFKVYIGDDNSPNDLHKIVNQFTDKLAITYKKFDDTLGAISLTQHWERCIEMVKNEEWIWLFSDDDLMDENCISDFNKALLSTRSAFDIYRFNTKIINKQGEIINTNVLHPEIESAGQLAIERLERKRSIYAVEYIFSKQRYLDSGKFVNFPMAWSSDEATWIRLATNTGVYTITGAFVYWRYSFTNISSSTRFNKEKIEATLLYLAWLKKWFNNQLALDNNIMARYEAAKVNWLQHQLRLLNKPFNLTEIYKLTHAFHQRLSISIKRSLILLMHLNLIFFKTKARSIKSALRIK